MYSNPINPYSFFSEVLTYSPIGFGGKPINHGFQHRHGSVPDRFSSVGIYQHQIVSPVGVSRLNNLQPITVGNEATVLLITKRSELHCLNCHFQILLEIFKMFVLNKLSYSRWLYVNIKK